LVEEVVVEVEDQMTVVVADHMEAQEVVVVVGVDHMEVAVEVDPTVAVGEVEVLTAVVVEEGLMEEIEEVEEVDLVETEVASTETQVTS